MPAQVFGKLTQICEVFKELNECGHPRYQRWSFHLLFNNPAQACEEVNDLYKKMLQQVCEIRLVITFLLSRSYS